jgi:hypothetical protein
LSAHWQFKGQAKMALTVEVKKLLNYHFILLLTDIRRQAHGFCGAAAIDTGGAL